MLKRDSNGIWKGEWNYFVDGQRKRIRKSSGTKSKAQAEEWHRKVDEELWRHFKLGVVHKYWADAVLGYLKNREEKASYDADLARIQWLNDHLEGKRIDQINTDLLTTIRDARLEEVAPATVNRMMNLVSAILHYAEGREWIVRAPRIPKAEVPEPDPEWLTPDEVSALIKELASKARTKHLVAYVTFGIATGLRMSNITKLEWSRIDLSTKSMWVEPSSSKSRRHISIPLAEDAIAGLRDQVGKHLVRVFTHKGQPFDRVNNRTLQSAAKRAGIQKHVHNHVFRHTFASWHIMSGTSLYELMKLGGWRKIESVMIYAHLSTAHMQQAASNRNMISDVFSEARNLMK